MQCNVQMQNNHRKTHWIYFSVFIVSNNTDWLIFCQCISNRVIEAQMPAYILIFSRRLHTHIVLYGIISYSSFRAPLFLSLNAECGICHAYKGNNIILILTGVQYSHLMIFMLKRKAYLHQCQQDIYINASYMQCDLSS